VSPARPALAADSRSVIGKQVQRLRRAGKLPAVVFGHGVPSSNVTLDAHEFELIRKHSGANTLFDLKVDGGRATPALVRGIQIHPVTRRPLHVDLFAVRMNEEMIVDVPVVTIGESTAVTTGGGTLNHVDSVKVRALPDHLPQVIEVSIDGLKTWDDAIYARDLAIPADVTLVTDPDELVVRVLPPRVEEVVETIETEAVAPAEAATEGEPAADEG
jgi:large subunit ribosomal protein L25